MFANRSNLRFSGALLLCGALVLALLLLAPLAPATAYAEEAETSCDNQLVVSLLDDDGEYAGTDTESPYLKDEAEGAAEAQLDDEQDLATSPESGIDEQTTAATTEPESEAVSTEQEPSVSYDVHVQDYGWLDSVSDGETSGTVGKSKRAEALTIEITGSSLGGGVKYESHVQNLGWESVALSDGEVSGTTGKSKRLEAIKIWLYGEIAQSYSIYYRGHVQNYGWLAWTSDGAAAGTAGYSLRLEAIQVMLVNKEGGVPPSGDGEAYIAPALTASAHVQNVGWTRSSTSAIGTSLVIGTVGKSLRLEAVKISISESLGVSGSIVYNSHVANQGWQGDISSTSSWKANGAVSGTSGKSRSIEAIELALVGDIADSYDLYYRAHVQDAGWLDWTQGGEMAGTVGLARRLEALEIILVSEGSAAPGSFGCSYADASSSYFSSIAITTKTSAGLDAGVVEVTCVDSVPTAYAFLPSYATGDSFDIVFQQTDGSEIGWISSDPLKGFVKVEGKTTIALSDYQSSLHDGTCVFYYRPNAYVSAQPLMLLRSANIAAMFLVSDDPVNRGMEYINGSANHSTKATGSMLMVDADGSVVYDNSLTQIKGRGNTTWSASEKKPYQIKLGKKTDLLETGSNKAKTWVLLANATDATLMRNTIAYQLAQALGLTSTPECRPVDLYYDGSYRGSYLLCEKVEIGSGRVDISDLEESNEDANSGIDVDSLPTAKGTNKYRQTFQYVTGMEDPDDITGGYLVELDGAYYASERCWFTTTKGTYVVKAPESCSYAQMKYISELFQGAINACAKRSGASKVDADSCAALFALNQFCKNIDWGCSSTFFYVPSADDDNSNHIIYAGPAWDFDTAFGIRLENDAQSPNTPWITNSTIWCATDTTISAAARSVTLNTLISLVEDGLLASKSAVAGIQSIDELAEQLCASQRMNQTLWGLTSFSNTANPYSTYEQNVNYLKNWLTQRVAWAKAYYA